MAVLEMPHMTHLMYPLNKRCISFILWLQIQSGILKDDDLDAVLRIASVAASRFQLKGAIRPSTASMSITPGGRGTMATTATTANGGQFSSITGGGHRIGNFPVNLGRGLGPHRSGGSLADVVRALQVCGRMQSMQLHFTN